MEEQKKPGYVRTKTRPELLSLQYMFFSSNFILLSNVPKNANNTTPTTNVARVPCPLRPTTHKCNNPFKDRTPIIHLAKTLEMKRKLNISSSPDFNLSSKALTSSSSPPHSSSSFSWSSPPFLERRRPR